MKRMPALETVAGVAFFNEFISKTIRIASLSGTRSLETKVRTCYIETRGQKKQRLEIRVLLVL